MRRILLVLTVAGLMAAMMVALAMPAFADPGNGSLHSQSDCNAGGGNGPDRSFGHHFDCDPGNSVNTPAANND